MKKYLDLEGFISFIGDLKLDEPQKIYTESLEDGHVDSYLFKKEEFDGSFIYLYKGIYGEVDILRDTTLIPIEDFIEGLFENLEMYGDYKIFIEE
jgi:hypothetical protein